MKVRKATPKVNRTNKQKCPECQPGFVISKAITGIVM
jgi:hypothetical protein